MGFFASANYDQNLHISWKDSNTQIPVKSLEEKSLCGTFENIADGCFAPGRWLASALWDGGQDYIIQGSIQRYVEINKDGIREPQKRPIGANAEARDVVLNTAHKIARLFFGVLLVLPGMIIGTFFMALAYGSEEVRLKHDFVAKAQAVATGEASVDDLDNIFLDLYEHFKSRASEKKPAASTSLKINDEEEWKGNSSWKTAQLDYKQSGNKTASFPYCPKTGEIYNQDPEFLIRIKGFLLLAVGTPVVTAIRTVYHTVMTALHLVLIQPYQLLDGRVSLSEAFDTLKDSFLDILRPAFYGIGLLFAALYTILSPLDGRQAYGSLERILNRQEDDPHPDTKFYMAPCFQRLGIYPEEDHPDKKATLEKTIYLLQRHVEFRQRFNR